MNKKWLNSFTVAVGFTLASLYIFSLDLPLVHQFELKSYDFKTRVRGVREISNQVVIVAIDEKSLKQEGRWPWPRDRMANLVDRIADSGAAVIGFDIFFPEKEDKISPEKMANAVRKKDFREFDDPALADWVRTVNDSDDQFADALLKSDRAVLGYFVFGLQGISGADAKELSPQSLDLLDFSQFSVVQRFHDLDAKVPLRTIQQIGLSLPKMMDAANSAGFVSFVPETDGVVRWVPMVMQYKDYLFPPLSLQMIHEATKLPLAINLYPFGVDQILMGANPVPTRENGDFLVNFYGPAFTFKHLSATNVLSGKVGKKELENKLVLIGGTAAGTHDIHTSPFGPLYPGVEVHANIIENILSQEFLIQPAWLKVLDWLMIIVSGVIIGIVATYFSAYATVALLFSGVVSYLLTDFYLFSQQGLWVNTVYPVFTQIFVYSGVTLYKYGFEQKEKRFIKGAFSQYLAPAVVNQLVENPELLKLGGERRIITSFFSDVAGFSSISEKLSPEDLVHLLNHYLTEMTDIIKKYEGTVDKFEGDAIIAFFGAPITYEDHAKRTCFVAIEMQKRLAELRTQWKSEGKAELYMRIGANTGPAVVGNMGSLTRMDYTMMGDSVNLSARLEGVNKQYKTETMISQFTYEKAKDYIEVRELDLIRVVGKNEPVKIFELLDRKGEVTPQKQEVLKFYNQGYELYKSRMWNEAAECFEKALAIDETDGPALTFFERCITFQVHPPSDDWDGVFSMGVK